MRYLPIAPALYTENRRRFRERMDRNTLAIVPPAPVLTASADQPYRYQPSADVVWMSGIVQEETMVVLFPDHPEEEWREVLVMLRPAPELEKWEGHKLTKEEATAISGIRKVVWRDAFDAQLHTMMHLADAVYVATNENDRLDTHLFRPDLLYVQALQARYPLHRWRRAARIFKELRGVKTPEEVAVLREAVSITDAAFRRVLGFIKPGVMEYEVEAEVTHEFIRRRATRHAYTPIIASGDRARVLHYIENNNRCEDGDLLLMDFGAEYGGYAADLTRTVPVSGKFTPRQAEVYNAVLDAHNHAKTLLKPGISIVEYTKEMNKVMEQHCLRLGLIKEEELSDGNLETGAYRKFFYHGVSHHLGLDVHDVGTRTAPITAGMLFTVEPGLYIEEEKIGIRIENDIWITEDGHIDLFEGIPITVEEIEAAMAGQ